jgi:hypothetical protein
MIKKLIKRKITNRIKRIKRPSWLALIISFSILLLVLTFGLFIYKFYDFPLSDNPSDWYNFIPIIVGVVNLTITGIIAWQVQTINKKNSRRNSVLQFLGEIYIQLDDCANRYLGKIALSLTDYDFSQTDVQLLIDNFEDDLKELKPKCFAFYNLDSSDSFSTLLNLVREFNFNLRDFKARNENISYPELFRLPKIIDTYVLLDQRYKRTKQLMRKYMNE